MNFFKMFFGKKNCGGCKFKNEKSMQDFILELNILKGKYNDLELDYVELENINNSLVSNIEELKLKNEELISMLLKILDISNIAIELNRKGH